MDNEQIKALCLSLMKADSEEDAVTVLKNAGYWDNHEVWRYYGDNENNFSVIGSQQSFPDAALIEKLVNSIDARLTKECLLAGIDPESDKAPKSIKEAVSWFFEENPGGYTSGLITEWDDKKRREISRGITLSATGSRPKVGTGLPCFTISDYGEGQTPSMIPRTLLSLNKSNKLRIPFVQGKFNMGGSGVLRFCGRRRLQLIVTRRDPRLLKPDESFPSDFHWGFTIVRRERPEGNARSSVYTYLAPIQAKVKPRKGSVLNFSSETMPIFPKVQEPYAVESDSGTLIKLYDYNIQGYKTHMFRKGLFNRVDLLLSEVALPIRFHECRDFEGKDKSFETTLTGLRVRLEDNKADNLESGFPQPCPMRVMGEKMTATIYAFKKGRAETYRGKKDGVIFTVNGQAQGDLSESFFKRKNAGNYSYLADSILVLVDCSELSPTAIEDLFMNSRDRLSGDELRNQIEKELEFLIRNNQDLKDLKERRRREVRDNQLEDSKPLEEILKNMLNKSPTLSHLFYKGTRISNPFQPHRATSKDHDWKGKRYPTYFRFKGLEYGKILTRECPINVRARIYFETDVENEYFNRKIDPGEFELFKVIDGKEFVYDTYSCNLRNGIATLNLKLPYACEIGDLLSFKAVATDRTKAIEPFINHILLKISAEQIQKKGGKSSRRNPPLERNGGNRELPSGMQLPNIQKVYESSVEGHKTWDDMTPPFDKYTALMAKNVGSDYDDYDSSGIYDFFINVDNIYLQNEIKGTKRDPVALTDCFVYGMTLLGMSLIHENINKIKSNEDQNEEDIEAKVAEFTKAVAPVLIPIIVDLGELSTV